MPSRREVGPKARRGWVFALLAATAACSPAGVEPPPERGGAVEVEEAAAAPQLYLVRARVDRADDGGQLWLRHEPIHDFTDITGAVSGMDSMLMPFAVAAGVPVDGLSDGDVVEIELEVDWRDAQPARIVALRPLPDGTVLEFGPARPPVGAP